MHLNLYWEKPKQDVQCFMELPLNSRSSWYMTLMHLLFILSFFIRASILKCRWVTWMLKWNIAETHYFDLKFMRRPNADVLLKNLDESISSLNRGQFLQLAMDGPQVNWNILKLLDEKLVSENLSKAVNIGSCAQHVAHGALKSSEFNINKILKSMFWLFESLSAQCDFCLKECISGKFPPR